MNMINEKLNEVIAECFETKPPLPTGHSEGWPDVSEKRFWVLMSRPGWHWHPVDFTGDPEWTVMLVQRMIRRFGWDWVHDRIHRQLNAMALEAGRLECSWADYCADHFQRAVAEAYLAAALEGLR